MFWCLRYSTAMSALRWRATPYTMRPSSKVTVATSKSVITRSGDPAKGPSKNHVTLTFQILPSPNPITLPSRFWKIFTPPLMFLLFLLWMCLSSSHMNHQYTAESFNSYLCPHRFHPFPFLLHALVFPPTQKHILYDFRMFVVQNSNPILVQYCSWKKMLNQLWKSARKKNDIFESVICGFVDWLLLTPPPSRYRHVFQIFSPPPSVTWFLDGPLDSKKHFLHVHRG